MSRIPPTVKDADTLALLRKVLTIMDALNARVTALELQLHEQRLPAKGYDDA